MDIRQVTDMFSVSPQIQPDDVDALKAAGYTAIVCNRPDEEEPGQPDYEAIATRARELGLTIHHLPIASGMFGPQHVTQMRAFVDEAEGRVLAYCRSGTRSIMLWAFSEVATRPRDEVLAETAAAGYDLSQQL